MSENEFIGQLKELIEEAQEQLADGQIAELLEAEVRNLRNGD